MGCHASLQGVFLTQDGAQVSHIAGRFLTAEPAHTLGTQNGSYHLSDRNTVLLFTDSMNIFYVPPKQLLTSSRSHTENMKFSVVLFLKDSELRVQTVFKLRLGLTIGTITFPKWTD